MINLSDSQELAVKADIGKPIQVLASPGTGKTRVLTERIKYILKNTKKDGVIALTFTNKAAEEMRSRLDDIDQIENRCWITTIHSIAQRILDQYGNTIGLPADLQIYEKNQDRQTIFLQSLINNNINVNTFLKSNNVKDRNKKIGLYMEHFSIFKKELLFEEEIKKKYKNGEALWSVYQNYQNALLSSGGIDFDDILMYAYNILLDQPWCGNIYRAKYKHICIDEAQDLNRAQYEFIKVLCSDKIRSIMMVGDPNQMIFGFNGSSHIYFTKWFVEDFSSLQFKLLKNYRCSKAIIRIANKLKPNSQIDADFAHDGKSEIKAFATEFEEAKWICNKISKIITTKNNVEIEGDILLDNMVIIGRNRFVFDALKKSLSEMGIKYFLKKGEMPIEPSSVFGNVLDLSIRIKINPKDWISRKKLCLILKISFSSNSNFLSISQDFFKHQNNASVFFPELQLILLNKVNDLNIEKPKIPAFCTFFDDYIKQLVTKISAAEDLKDMQPELERSMQELKEFRKRWSLFKIKGLGESLISFRNAIALGKMSEDNDPKGLTLSTVHTMKGLEKDIVFLTSMCEGTFPDYRALTPSKIDEERNNAFVAVTRARRWIYITYSNQKTMPWGGVKAQKPSRFIFEMRDKH